MVGRVLPKPRCVVTAVEAAIVGDEATLVSTKLTVKHLLNFCAKIVELASAGELVRAMGKKIPALGG